MPCASQPARVTIKPEGKPSTYNARQFLSRKVLEWRAHEAFGKRASGVITQHYSLLSSQELSSRTTVHGWAGCAWQELGGRLPITQMSKSGRSSPHSFFLKDTLEQWPGSSLGTLYQQDPLVQGPMAISYYLGDYKRGRGCRWPPECRWTILSLRYADCNHTGRRSGWGLMKRGKPCRGRLTHSHARGREICFVCDVSRSIFFPLRHTGSPTLPHLQDLVNENALFFAHLSTLKAVDSLPLLSSVASLWSLWGNSSDHDVMTHCPLWTKMGEGLCVM